MTDFNCQNFDNSMRILISMFSNIYVIININISKYNRLPVAK